MNITSHYNDASKTPTGDFLSHLIHFSRDNEQNFNYPVTANEAHDSIIFLAEKVQASYAFDMDTEAAKLAAGEIGVRIALARSFGNTNAIVAANHDLALVMSRVVVPDRDEARRRAAVMAENAATDFLELQDKDSAAIAAMNSALCYLELAKPSTDELMLAYEQLNRTFSWRKKGSVGSAYHNFTRSIARRRLLEVGELERSDANFGKVVQGFKRAFQLFNKFHEEVDHASYHENVIETLIPWVHWKRLEFDKNFFQRRIQEFAHDLRDNPIESPDILDTLRINPESLGFEQTPEWVPTEKEVLLEVTNRIPHFQTRLEQAEGHLGDNPSAHRLATVLSRLKQMLGPLAGLPEIPYRSLESLWNTGDYAAYLSEVLTTVGSDAGSQEQSDDYVLTLMRVFLGFRRLRGEWSSQGLHQLLEDFSTQFRFCACELARHGRWEEAFELLEDTRGLIASGTASLLDDGAKNAAVLVESTESDDRLWIHVTHSPTATYLISNRGKEYFGTELPEISGSILANYFAGLKPAGLIHPISKQNRAIRAAAIQRISGLLKPIAAWMLEQNAPVVILHAGGFYQTFPIWSVGDLPEAIENFQVKFFQVPSKSLGKNRSTPNLQLPLELEIQEAADVHGAESLREARLEAEWLAQTAPAEWKSRSSTATPSAVVEAARTSHFLHFTGHSSAALDPQLSSLLTYAGQLTVGAILEHRASAQLVFLSSCESGLPQNYAKQDEQLSVQSAFWYAGASYCIGSYWPVSDRVASEFARYFYRALFQEIGCDAHNVGEKIYRAWVTAMHHLRREKPDAIIDWGSFGLLGMPTTFSRDVAV